MRGMRGGSDIHSIINKKIFPYPFVLFEHNITIKKYLASFLIYYYINIINLNITYKFLIIIIITSFLFILFPYFQKLT